jgi:hypothetical protein
MAVQYQLRPPYVGSYGGGSIAVGKYATTFDVGAALAAGGGTITAGALPITAPWRTGRRSRERR